MKLKCTMERLGNSDLWRVIKVFYVTEDGYSGADFVQDHGLDYATFQLVNEDQRDESETKRRAQP